MSDFDPYHLWLQIPPAEQPPNHYRLLGLAELESDANVIDNATEQRLLHLRSVQNGPQGRVAQKLMNEVSQARVTLLDEKKKSDYDAQLRQTLLPPKQSVGAKPPKSESSAPVASSPAVSVSTRATSQSLAYARRKKKSALMAGGGIVVLIVLIAGVGYFIWKNQRGGGNVAGDPESKKEKSESTNDKKKSNEQNKNTGRTRKKQKTDPRNKNQTQGTGRKSVSDNGNKKKENDKKGQRKTTPRIDQAYLDKLYKETFSDESEKALAIGEPISLFEHLKLPENLKQGVARFQNNKLILESTSSMNLVDFPIMLPAHYDVHATVTRLRLTPGQNTVHDGFGFGIHVANHPCCFAIDHFPDKGFLTGPRTFINDLDSTRRLEAVQGPVFEVDKPTKIKLQVRPTGIMMYVDDDAKYIWQGTPVNLKPLPNMMPGTRNLFQFWLMSWKSRFQIEDLKLIPRGLAAVDEQWLTKSTVDNSEELGRPVDLIAKFNPAYVFTQPVRKDRFGIALGPRKRLAGFEIPMEVADEYDLKMSVMAKGPEGLVVCLPIVDRQAMLVIDHERRRNNRPYYRTALELINGRYMDHPSHLGGLPVKLLNNQRDTQLEIKVRRDSIRLFVNDKFTYGWSGSRYRLSIPNWRGLSINRSLLRLRVLCMDDPVLIKKFTYRPVEKTNRLTDDFDQLVGVVQKINPSLVDFWSKYEVAMEMPTGTYVFDPNKPKPRIGLNLGSNKSIPMDPVDDVDLNDLIGSRKLSLSNLDDDELAVFEAVRKDVAEICQQLLDKEFDDATAAIETAQEKYDLEQAKKLLDGLDTVAQDWKAFWQDIPDRCALLKSTQQLEFSDSAASVVSASDEEIRLRYGGENKSYRTDELPLGIAMKIYEVTSSDQDGPYLRARGSVFFMASLDDAKYGVKAVQTWLDAEKSGEDVNNLVILVPK